MLFSQLAGVCSSGRRSFQLGGRVASNLRLMWDEGRAHRRSQPQCRHGICEFPAMDSFTNDGLNFGVRDQGPPDGEPIVLLHGYPLWASSWDLVVGSLHKRGYRTLA
jgi:hypothetical protein